MKKSIIAAGAASVALAAMPIVGAFATDAVRDAITANIGAGCTIQNTADPSSTISTNNVSVSVTPGSTGTSSTDYAGMTVICNSTSWSVSAVGSGTGTDATSLYSGTNEIQTGTATSGDSSAWAFKIASASNATIETGYTGFTTVPATATPVVTGSAAATSTIKAQYQVYASTGQASGNYTGGVTYTVAAN